MLFFWLTHILFIGWYRYLFCANGYLIKAKDIIEDVDSRNGKWWNKHHCEIAKKAVAFNDPDDLVMFTWRTHPFFLDNDILYVKSKGFHARAWDHREKIYRFC